MIANITPNSNHVICGRGKVNAKHAGNVKFAGIVRSSLAAYIQAPSRIDKAIVVASIVTFIREECGLQFIKFNNATQQYVELSPERIHDKVSHAIRDEMRKNGKPANKQRPLKKSMKRRLLSSPPKPTPDFSYMSMKGCTTAGRLSTNVAKMTFSSTIFDLGEKVQEMCSDNAAEASLESILSDCNFVPANIMNASLSTHDEHDISPLPADFGLAHNLDFEYDDMQRVCAILDREESEGQLDFSRLYNQIFQ